jgi:phosphohistidine phosphatase
MRVYLLRHGAASLRKSSLKSDDDRRPLTDAGKRKLRAAAAGMRAAGLRVDRVLSSPVLRAVQTARIVAPRLRPRPPVRCIDELSPDSRPEILLATLSQLSKSPSILLVGHEPGLSRLAALMLLGPGGDAHLEFKKGGLCRIDFPASPRPGAGRLVFHLPPRLLRRLARRRD